MRLPCREHWGKNECTSGERPTLVDGDTNIPYPPNGPEMGPLGGYTFCLILRISLNRKGSLRGAQEKCGVILNDPRATNRAEEYKPVGRSADNFHVN